MMELQKAPRGVSPPRDGKPIKEAHMEDVTTPAVGEIRRAKELGYKGWARFQFHACEVCKTPRWVQYNQLLAGRHKICKTCANEKRKEKLSGWRGETHPSWQGGKGIYNGYVYIRLPGDNPFFSMVGKNGYVKEHRLIMAQHLKRLLKTTEVVHHLNGNKTDNRIENLCLCNTQSSHMRLEFSRHLQQRVLELEAEVKSLRKLL